MQTYLNLLQDILDNGEAHNDRTGVGTTSVFGRQWRHNMATGFPLLTTKKVPLRWVFEELRWFLSGSSQEADLRKNGVDIWSEWATAEQCNKFNRAEGDLGPIYGPMMRGFPLGPSEHDRDFNEDNSQIDQIACLLQDIQNDPNSRRLIVTHWHPYYARRVTLPPCHTLWQVKVHSNYKMSLHLYCRSIDAFLGLPFNIASYALLLTMLCNVTRKIPRDLIISFGDLHIYNSHLTAVKEQLKREPLHLPMVTTIKNIVGSPLEQLLGFTWGDVIITNYKHHPKIEAPVAI